MIGSAVARRYATALFDLAEEQKLVSRMATDLAELAGIWEASEPLRTVFASPQVGMEEKRSVIRAIAERAKVHDLVKSAAQMLSDRRRLAYLPEISEVFARIAEARSGRVRAEIVTATKLSEAYYEKLEKTLRDATGKDVVLVRREDPSLLGGVVTTVGGRVFDGSLKNRLKGLREQLLASTDPATLALLAKE